jgi:hypothetical protein
MESFVLHMSWRYKLTHKTFMAFSLNSTNFLTFTPKNPVFLIVSGLRNNDDEWCAWVMSNLTENDRWSRAMDGILLPEEYAYFKKKKLLKVTRDHHRTRKNNQRLAFSLSFVDGLATA